MAGFICSARSIEALVRGHSLLGRVCASQLPPVAVRRSARPLSSRHFSLAAKTRSPAVTTQASSDDTFVPLVEDALPSAQQKPFWPKPRSASSRSDPSDALELEVDQEQLNILLEDGLRGISLEERTIEQQRSGSDVDETSSPAGSDGEHKHPLGHDNATPLEAGHGEADAAARTSFEQHGDQPSPATRADNRKARRERRIRDGLLVERDAPLGKKPPTSKRGDNLVSERRGLGPLDSEHAEVSSLLEEVKMAQAMDESPFLGHVVSKTRVTPKSRINTKRHSAAEKDEKDSFSRVGSGKDAEPWMAYKRTLQEKFGGQGWTPRKRISPDAIAGLRSLNASDPKQYSTARLSEYLQISPEAVRRILKGKWQPNEDEASERRQRWEKRGEKKWNEMVELGVRPPRKWREMGVGRAPLGQMPKWRQGQKGGERWIEHRPPEALFAAAAVQTAQQDKRPMRIASKIF